jgi:hypothetical protein
VRERLRLRGHRNNCRALGAPKTTRSSPRASDSRASSDGRAKRARVRSVERGGCKLDGTWRTRAPSTAIRAGQWPAFDRAQFPGESWHKSSEAPESRPGDSHDHRPHPSHRWPAARRHRPDLRDLALSSPTRIDRPKGSWPREASQASPGRLTLLGWLSEHESSLSIC